MKFEESGDINAPLIVFLHGGGVSGWMWDQQVAYFSHYHCLVPQLPEHGLNNHDMKFSIKESAEELIQLIEEKANGKTVILIGFSLGAQIVIEIVSKRPKLAQYAMINSALVRSITYPKWLLHGTIRLSYPFIKQRWFAKLQSKTLYINEEYFEKYYEESCQLSVETLIRVLEENMSFTIPKEFSKVTGKLLVTVGEKEKSIMKQSAKDLVNANPNSLGVIIPNVGHGAPLATPKFFNQLVEEWLVTKTTS